jgi:hypothetical protein
MYGSGIGNFWHPMDAIKMFEHVPTERERLLESTLEIVSKRTQEIEAALKEPLCNPSPETEIEPRRLMALELLSLRELHDWIKKAGVGITKEEAERDAAWESERQAEVEAAAAAQAQQEAREARFGAWSKLDELKVELSRQGDTVGSLEQLLIRSWGVPTQAERNQSERALNSAKRSMAGLQNEIAVLEEQLGPATTEDVEDWKAQLIDLTTQHSQLRERVWTLERSLSQLENHPMKNNAHVDSLRGQLSEASRAAANPPFGAEMAGLRKRLAHWAPDEFDESGQARKSSALDGPTKKNKW